MAKNKGIDYGMGTTNVDRANGIRYGVLPQDDVLQAWADSSESVYPDPEPVECESCGGSGELPDPERAEGSDDTVECEDCAGSGKVEPDDDCCDCCEPIGFVYDAEGYKAECGSDGDIFITLSPYYTHAPFCSPCAPGACYLRDGSTADSGFARAYCFGHDWFWDSDTKRAPYPVYSVATGELVNPEPEA